jgi:hypothetical protein
VTREGETARNVGSISAPFIRRPVATTLLVFGLDHNVTQQEAAPEEIEAVRQFLAREGTCLILGPHHEVGVSEDPNVRNMEYRHHGDALVPRLAKRLEQRLAAEGAGAVMTRYEALKAYLMLFGGTHFDAAALRAYLLADWDAGPARLGNGGSPKLFVQLGGVEFFNRGHCALHGGGRGLLAWRRGRRGYGKFAHQLPQLLHGQSRDVANAVASMRCGPQQRQSLNLFV